MLRFSFTADESPHFVALYFGHRDSVNFLFKEALALLANQNEQRQNRGVMQASDALHAGDGASFNKKLYRVTSPFEGRVHVAERGGVIFGESLAALLAAIALKSVSVFTKCLAAGIAVVTGHLGLPFSGSKPIMSLDSALRLVPRADLAPLSVSAEGGASLFPINPFLGECIAKRLIPYSFNLIAFFQSFKDCVNGRKEIYLLDSYPGIQQKISKLCRGECLAGIKCAPYGVRKSNLGNRNPINTEPSIDIGWIGARQFSKQADAFLKAAYFLIEHTSLTKPLKQILLRLFQCREVCQIVHKRSLTVCL